MRAGEAGDRPGPRVAGAVLLAALGLGVAADRLLWEGPLGPGLALWIALLGGCAFFLARSRGWQWSGATGAWSIVAVLAAAGTAWRASPELRLLFLLVLVVSASMVLLEARGRSLGRTRVLDHVYGLALVPLRSAIGALPLVGAVNRHAMSSLAPDRRRAVSLGRGVLLAVPPLVVFAALFASADPSFERLATRLTAGLQDLPPHIFLTLVLGWIAAGLLGGVFPAPGGNPLARLRAPKVGAEEVAVVLGLVSALFVVFLGLQFSYLFGGEAAIEAASGMTVAEYARRGFFELVVVAGLVLALLLAVEAASPRDSGRWIFRALAGLLIGLVMLVIASAALRLRLYILEYGLTTDRVYAAAIMMWIGASLLIYAATVIRGRPRPFASGALIAGIATVAALAVFNPDATVARTNLTRASDRPVDHAYLTRLSADAVPAIVTRLEAIAPEARCRLVSTFHERLSDPEAQAERDWRTWSVGEARARRALEAMAVVEAVEACEGPAA